MKKKSNDPVRTYLMFYTDAHKSQSFDAMRPLAKLLVVLAKQYYHRKKMDVIFVSVRGVCKLLGIKSKDLARSLIEEAIHHGFWERMSKGYLGTQGIGVAAAYRLTDEKYKGQEPTLDYLRWEGDCYWNPAAKPNHFATLNDQRRAARRKRQKSEARTSNRYRPVHGQCPPPYIGDVQAPQKAHKTEGEPVHEECTHLDNLATMPERVRQGGEAVQPDPPKSANGNGAASSAANGVGDLLNAVWDRLGEKANVDRLVDQLIERYGTAEAAIEAVKSGKARFVKGGAVH